MGQDKTWKIRKPLQIKDFGTRRDYLTRRHMQFESLLLRQKRPVILKITGLFVVQWQSGNGILVISYQMSV